MTAPIKKLFIVGLNAARIYALEGDALYSNGATAYDGIALGGPVTFNYEPPDPESVAHPGNNYVLQRDTLPSLDASSATLEVSRTDIGTIADLTSVKTHTPATDINSVAWKTSQQGGEPTVALVLYAQAKTSAGARAWSTYVFPRAVIVPKPKSMSREQSNHVYFVQPQTATAHLYGVALSEANDGCTSAEMIEYQSNRRLHFAAWEAPDGTTTEFSFAASLKYGGAGSGGIVVTKNGALCTYSATPTTNTQYSVDADGIVFGAALAQGDKIIALYELADDAVDVE